MIRQRGWVLAVALLALGACSAGQAPTGIYIEQPPGPPNDADRPAKGDNYAPPQRTLLQGVVSGVTLPLSGDQFAADLDGDGVADNQVGRLLGQLKQLLDLDLQTPLNKHLAQGQSTVLVQVLGSDLTQDPSATLQLMLGQDLDQDPLNNYDGSGRFRIAADDGLRATLPSAIDAGQLLSTEPGPAFVALPFTTETTVLPLKMSRVRAAVDAQGLHQGVLVGALPMVVASQMLVPVIVSELNRVYNMPDASPKTVQGLRVLLDSNDDGQITEAELTQSSSFGFLLHTADSDTNGDGVADALSFGLSFRTVPCTIVD